MCTKPTFEEAISTVMFKMPDSKQILEAKCTSMEIMEVETKGTMKEKVVGWTKVSHGQS